MKVSLNWLQKYLPLKAAPSEIAEVLTMQGLEVEEIIPMGVVSDKIVSAEVKTCQKHPDADKLSVCEVFDGSDTYPVVCGAPNVKANQKVVFAKVGAVLPGDFKIKKAKIRGIVSQGMICAEDEIGIGTRHDGIIELPEDTAIGVPLQQIPGMFDTILDLAITPNRPDALSHVGVARELAGHYKLPFKLPTPKQTTPAQKPNFKIKVSDAEGCPMYTAKVIRDAKVGPSPEWLVKALESVDQKSINNVVDLSNYVLMEFGQPSHTFDLGKVKGDSLTIRRGKSDETLETLDNVKRKISEDDLVIADSSGPVCLAGVMGGESTKVDDSTTSILVEVAYFQPKAIRVQGRRHQLSSDSSYRFERGIDPLNVNEISDYLTGLICELTGGVLESIPEPFISPTHPREKINIELRPDKVNRLLGLNLSPSEITSLLENIQIAENPTENKDRLSFSIPGFRPDLTREVDLIEEVARLYNFNNIPVTLPTYSPSVNELPPAESLALTIRKHLSFIGLNECIHLRFAPLKHLESFGFTLEGNPIEAVKLLNPLSEETETLPVSLLHNMLVAAAKNQRNQEKSCRFFEVGKTFSNNAEARDKKNPGVIEELKLAIVLTGDWPLNSWNTENQTLNYYTLKGILENLLNTLGVKYKFNYETPAHWVHPGESASIISRNQNIAQFGTLHPKIIKKYGLEGKVYVCELSLSELLNAKKRKEEFKPFSTSVSTKREMNIVVDRQMTHQTLLDLMPLGNAKYLEQVKLNSVYTGEGIPENKKALNYSFIYRHPTDTLTDEVVNKIQDKIAKQLEQNPEISFK